MRLSLGKTKNKYEVLEVIDCKEKNMLESMGFVANTKIEILANSLFNKTLLISILNSTVAIKKTVLEQVEVKELKWK